MNALRRLSRLCTLLSLHWLPKGYEPKLDGLTHLTLCKLGNFSCFCCLLIFFKLSFSKKIRKILLEITSICQTIWIQTRTDILSVLIWVQTVRKGYQHRTKVATSKERVYKRKIMPGKEPKGIKVYSLISS